MSNSDPLFGEQISSIAAGADKILSVPDLITTFKKAIDSESLLFIDVSWTGCSGCLNMDVKDAVEEAMASYPTAIFRAIPWREKPSYISPVNPAFTLFTEIVRGHKQRFSNDREVTNYSCNPPWARVHFPQMFFINGKRLVQNRISMIERLYNNEELFNDNGELLFFLENTETSSQQNDRLRDAITGAIYHGGVLLQLLNEHLFGLSNLAFQSMAYKEMFKCVHDKFSDEQMELTDCLAYHRVSRE